MNKYAVGETVRILGGFAHLRGEAAVESTGKDMKGRPIYRLAGIDAWWPESSLEHVTYKQPAMHLDGAYLVLEDDES